MTSAEASASRPTACAICQSFPGIRRQHQGEAFFSVVHLTKPHPGAHAVGDRIDTVRLGAMGQSLKLKVRVTHLRFLERGNAGEQTAVDLGQNDMHREIGRRQTALSFSPSLRSRGRKRDLKYRHLSGIEW